MSIATDESTKNTRYFMMTVEEVTKFAQEAFAAGAQLSLTDPSLTPEHRSQLAETWAEAHLGELSVSGAHSAWTPKR